MTEKMSLIGLSILIFTVISIFTRPKTSLADRLLCVWLIIIAIPMLKEMQLEFTIAGFNLWHLYNPTFNLLHGPLLYFYVRLLTQIRPIFSRRDLFHLAPFLFVYLLSGFTELSLEMIPGGSLNSEALIRSSNMLVAAIETLLLHFGILNVLSFLVYSVGVVRLLIRHQQKISSYFSRNDTQISLTWIYSLPVTFLIIISLNILNESELALLPTLYPLTLHILSHCCLAVLLCFFGVRQKPVFAPESIVQDQPKDEIVEKDNISVQLSNSEDIELAAQPESNSQLFEPNEVETFKTQIHTYMLKEKSFLDPDFSVYALAEAIELPRRALSFVLSSGFNKNFYQFVNSYRLEEMKCQLQDPENKETILDIAFACGFSSKSTYNTLFKKQCGCTPTQFRNRVI